MHYFYRKSNRGHEICPLYRGCPPFGESVIRGFTVRGSELHKYSVAVLILHQIEYARYDLVISTYM